MKILEIKNSLVKISYEVEDDLALSGFAIIEDTNTPYVAQVVNLKAENGRNFAVLKLLFTFNNDGVLKNYNGTIPSLDATITKLPSEELLSILPMDHPVYLGLLAQQNVPFKLDSSVLESNLLICSNNVDNTSKLLSNLLPQMVEEGKKSVLLDVNGDFASDENFTFGKDFKLPLNSQFLDYIFENDLDGVEPVSKAVIQDIFKEVEDYMESLPEGYLPIDLFINVVQQQYVETGIPELVLLKNKLQKYQQTNVFAGGNDDVNLFRNKVAHSNSLIVDISNVNLPLQKLLIPYLFDCISTVSADTFVLISVNNDVADKRLLRKTLEFKNIYTTIICGHEFKYLPDLKQIIQNLVLFAPQTLQHDFANYNTFLNKLNVDEFVVYGPATQNIPLVIQVKPYEELVELDKKLALEAEKAEQNLQNTEIIEPVNVSEDSMFTPSQTSTMEIGSSIEEVSLPSEPEQFVDIQPIEAMDAIQNTSVVEEVSPAVEISESPRIETVEELEIPTFQEEISELSDTNETSTFEQEAIQSREILEEQVANDVDAALYRKFEEETLESENEVDPEVLLEEDEPELTENDLDFIQSMPMEDETQEVYSSDEFIQEDLEQPSVEDLEASVLDEGAIEELEVDNTQVFIDDDEDINDSDDSQMVPIYTPEEMKEENNSSDLFEAGDVVSHPKYGQGVVEKMINYGNKTLCSISFVNIGRRLLDPNLSELTLVSRGGVIVNN